MKIKKLSLLGFKSFMDKIDISFSSGISGVVGPNGCGKSNIVDAIRWCMGEQSPKQLRGRKMEDILFGGAGDLKPFGMAEVCLVFENGDGSFPAAYESYSELSVTRRLFRSGESEYLINNVPCRLKDIQEIFMDTGLGNKAYSVIGQGKIGSIIDQKPEETRAMLEEAAGVTKYIKQRETSQRKIELTKGNLQRVEDIMGEIQKQMRSLKRQASKAKRYKVVCERIQNLEIILNANTYHQLKEESGSKLKSTEDLEQQEIAKSTELAQVHARVERMNLELDEKDDLLSGLKSNCFRLRERVHKKEAGLDSLAQEMRMQEEMEGRLKNEKEDIKTQLAGLREERNRLKMEIEDMAVKSQGMEGETALKEKMFRSRGDRLKEIKEDFEKARSELSAGANKEVGLSHESGYLSKMLNKITDSSSRLENELEQIKAKIKTTAKASDRKGLAREATAERLSEIEDAIEDQKMNLEELEQIRKRVETELKAAETDFNACQTRLTSLQSMAENFEGFKLGVRTIMKADDLEPRNQGHITGILADVIQVDPKHEQAVEAAFSDKLQYILVQSQEDGRQAVNYLKKRARGRGSFIPLNDLKCTPKAQKKNSDSPLLSEFVTVDDRYKPMVNALLWNTFLVQDLEAALSAWKNYQHTPGQNGGCPAFVTLEGDIVDHRGVISGGKLSQSSRGLLSRKREIEELKKKSSNYARKAEDLQLELENIITDIEQKKSAIEDLSEEKWTCHDEINEFDKILFRFGQELDQLQKMGQKITEDLGRKGREKDKHKEKLLIIEEELRQCKERHQVEENYFREKEIELKECEEEFDQFREELTKLKSDYRINKEEQRSKAREVERLDDHANDSLKRIGKIEEEIALGQRKCEECVRRREALGEELLSLNEKLQKAEEDMNLAERNRQEFHSVIRETKAKAEQLRDEIEALKDTLNRARMEHSEINFKMNNLLQLVREKFNQDLSTIYPQHIAEDFSYSETEEELEHQKKLRQRLGEVNLTAIKEHEALKERYEFIQNQREDLLNSIESLRVAIARINRTTVQKFKQVLQEIDQKLKEIFPILFNGGTAGLKLIDENNPLESGVLVQVQPPGKKISHMGLLSGGEKALVAMSLLFAIYMIKPSPFCLLDEVDAPLDEANIDRFNNLLEEIKRASQIIMVTHSRRTMEISDRLYGVTMEKAGVPKLVAVDFKGVNDRVSVN